MNEEEEEERFGLCLSEERCQVVGDTVINRARAHAKTRPVFRIFENFSQLRNKTDRNFHTRNLQYQIQVFSFKRQWQYRPDFFFLNSEFQGFS